MGWPGSRDTHKANEASVQVSRGSKELPGQMESPSWEGKPGWSQEVYCVRILVNHHRDLNTEFKPDKGEAEKGEV